MNYLLPALKRTTAGEKTREEGVLPAVVYGAGKDSESLGLDPAQFLKLYRAAGESSLIDLTIGGAEAGKVLVQEVQYHPVTGRIIHVDLRRIDMSKPVITMVELKLAGEAPIIKSSGGTVVASLNQVEVKCLPKDLVSSLEVDLSPLTAYDVVLTVGDLKVPTGITIISPAANALVVKAMPALTEEEMKRMEQAGPSDISQIEVAEKKPKEAEGEAAAADTASKAEEKK